jgi:hypothetical protein
MGMRQPLRFLDLVSSRKVLIPVSDARSSAGAIASCSQRLVRRGVYDDDFRAAVGALATNRPARRDDGKTLARRSFGWPGDPGRSGHLSFASFPGRVICRIPRDAGPCGQTAALGRSPGTAQLVETRGWHRL